MLQAQCHNDLKKFVTAFETVNTRVYFIHVFSRWDVQLIRSTLLCSGRRLIAEIRGRATLIRAQSRNAAQAAGIFSLLSRFSTISAVQMN